MKKILLALMILTFFVGCTQPPKDKIDAARFAMSRTEKSADVVTYAPDSLARVKSALDQMEAKLAAKNYKLVEAYSDEVVKFANEAIKDASVNKDKARVSAEMFLASINSLLPDVEKLALISKKIGKTDFLADISKAKADKAAMEGMLSTGDYLGARDMGGVLLATLSDIQSKIGAASSSGKKK